MPTIVLRGLDPALVAAIKAEADRRGLSLRAMTIELLQAGLVLAAGEGGATCGR
jgi:hypothetical protein